MTKLIAACLALAFATPATAQVAGLFARDNREDLAPIMLSSDRPLAEAPLVLKSGRYYEIEIVSDGSAEIAIAGAGFFRAIWIDEIVINDIEIRPMAIDSLEFDDEGTAEISFIAIKPGRYELRIPGTSSAERAVQITIE